MSLDPDGVDGQYMRIFSRAGAFELDLEPGTHQLTYFQSTRSVRLAASLRPGLWYHVAIVSDNLQVTLYLNGQQQAQFTASGPPPANSSPLVLSGQAFGDGAQFCCGFPGALRQFRIWGRALQVSEVSSVATKLLSGTEAGLITDWPIDEGQGQTLHDLGPNHLALQLTSSRPLAWKRTAIVDGGPYFQVRRSTVPNTPAQQPELLIPIDFNSDGNMDLLVCGNIVHTLKKWPCTALRNDGTGTFTDVTLQVLGTNPPAYETPGDYCVADFNRDGRSDVFIFNASDCCGNPPTQSGLLLQTPDGRPQDVSATNLPQQLLNGGAGACGDIDGDGDVDVFLVSGFFGLPQIYLNDGQGHFTVGDPGRLPPVLRANPSQFPVLKSTFIDMNRDGRLHLFLSVDGQWAGQARDLLLLNDGHGFFTPAPDTALPTKSGGKAWTTESSRVVDIDGDGWPDLINTVTAPLYAEGTVQILLNNHDGTFRDAAERILQPAWPRTGTLFSESLVWLDRTYAADFNGDGFIDVLVQGGNQPSRLFLNTGPAAGSRLVEVTDLLPRQADHYAVADFNNDGSPDLAALVLDCCNAAVLETWFYSGKFTLTPDLIPGVPTGPFFLRGSVLNSASFTADALAPGELVTIFGRGFGPDTVAAASPANGSYPSQLSGVRVLFNNVAAPILYTGTGVVSAIVPFSVVPKTRADVVVEYKGVQSPAVSIFVDRSAPGLFTSDGSGGGGAAVLNVDSVTGAVSLNTPQNPARAGGVIVAYITGAAQTDPASMDGVLAPSAGAQALPVEAGLDFFWPSEMPCKSNSGCVPVQVLYAGPAPGIVAGVTQINMRLPDTLSSGSRNLGISVGGVWSQYNVKISVR
jgi:uncharacterized protein (TIGR03437 family)